ncbi:unnamed protein product [Auanema sp. JU1783]|nr:unnamed protein product [Auanema sp. JU1783]
MDARGIFRDERRDRLRKKTKVGFFEDYFFRSEVTDYKKLRYIVNGFIGVIVCTCIYYMGWKRLNFADFHPIYSILFQWVMILMIVFAFSASAMFRCALFCVLLGSLGKNGQAPLTMMLFDNLREGPMENIITNYRLTAEIIVCHLELQAKIISNRVSLFTGPLEAVLETQLNRGLKVLKKATSFVRRLIAPFMNEISPKYTKEDEILDKTDKQLQILVRRRALGVATDDELHSLTELEMRNITNSQPFWSRFKTDIGRRIAHRMSKKCNDIFSKGVETCREVFLGVENKCYDTLPFIINFLVCKRLNMESACQDIDRRRKSFKLCQSHLESSNIGSAMEADILEVANLTTELDREAAVNIHMVGIENPRVEFIYSISEISLMVRHTAAHAKASHKYY